VLFRSTSQIGSHSLSFASVDALGNRETTRTVSFKVAAPPVSDAPAAGSGVQLAAGPGASVVVTAPAAAGAPASSATVRFTTITAPGVLTLARGTFTTPYGWRSFGRSWHVASAATAAGTVDVTLPYEPLLTASRAKGLRVLEWNGYAWQARTPVADTSARKLKTTFDATKPIGPLVIAESASVSRVSRLTLSGDSRLSPAYGSKAYVTLWLKDYSGSVLAGRSVKLHRADGTVATTLKASTTKPGYYYGYAPLVRSKTVFSARFAGDVANSGTSLSVKVLPKAKLGVNAPETPSKYKTFYATGSISPAHGKAVVKFEAWKKSKSTGKYYKYKTSSVTTSSSSYRKSFSLPAGRWRFRTTHSDTTHAYSKSGWDYITIK